MSETNEQWTEERRRLMNGDVEVVVWLEDRSPHCVIIRKSWRTTKGQSATWRAAQVDWSGVIDSNATGAAMMIGALARAVVVAAEMDAEFPTGSAYTPN